MKKIKFRAEDLDGVVHYGQGIVGTPEEPFLTSWNNGVGVRIRVKPETVAQFVRLDDDGTEIYEGDKVKFTVKTGYSFFNSETFITDGLVSVSECVLRDSPFLINDKVSVRKIEDD